jgi:integrase
MGRKRRLHRNLPENMRVSHGAYYITAYDNGKQRWLPLGRDVTAAFAKYRELTGAASPVGRTVNDLADRFVREELPKLRPNTRRVYKVWIPAIRKTWGEMSVKDLRQPDAAVFLDTYPEKVTANRVVTLLTTMLKRAKRWGWIETNHIEGIEKNAEHRRVRRITDEEWPRLLEVSEPMWRLLLRLARFTALRRTDICNLTWAVVKGDRFVVVTSKTQAPLSLEIAGELEEILTELKRGITPFPTRPMFSISGGRPLRSHMLGYHFDAIREKAGLRDVNFHDIRRTRITELTEKYGEEFAQKVAAHASRQSTARYNVPDAVRIDWPAGEIRGGKPDKSRP